MRWFFAKKKSGHKPLERKFFSRVVGSDNESDSILLELWRDGKSEIEIYLSLDNVCSVYLDESKSYSAAELKEILEWTVPFSIESAETNNWIRTQDEERRKTIGGEGTAVDL